jgi:Cwf15/Cwc15 cell cycle control protein
MSEIWIVNTGHHRVTSWTEMKHENEGYSTVARNTMLRYRFKLAVWSLQPLISQHFDLLSSLTSFPTSLVHKMSTAHRPTWDPAQAREVKGGSRQYSVRDMAAHTKLKFRCGDALSLTYLSRGCSFSLSKTVHFFWVCLSDFFPHSFRQAGQTSVNEVKRSDLRAELLAAEAEARTKKRKAAGLPVEEEQPVVAAIEGEEANKRRKLLQEALELDKDSDSDEDEGEDGTKDGAKGGDVKCVARFYGLSSLATHNLAPSKQRK